MFLFLFWNFQATATTQVLFDQVIKYLGLTETFFFGLTQLQGERKYCAWHNWFKLHLLKEYPRYCYFDENIQSCKLLNWSMYVDSAYYYCTPHSHHSTHDNTHHALKTTFWLLVSLLYVNENFKQMVREIFLLFFLIFPALDYITSEKCIVTPNFIYFILFSISTLWHCNLY